MAQGTASVDSWGRPILQMEGLPASASLGNTTVSVEKNGALTITQGDKAPIMAAPNGLLLTDETHVNEGVAIRAVIAAMGALNDGKLSGNEKAALTTYLEAPVATDIFDNKAREGFNKFAHLDEATRHAILAKASEFSGEIASPAGVERFADAALLIAQYYNPETPDLEGAVRAAGEHIAPAPTPAVAPAGQGAGALGV